MIKSILILFAAVPIFMTFSEGAEFKELTVSRYDHQILLDTIPSVLEATGPEWPDEVPFDAPQFSEGTIVAAVCNDPDSQTNWTIIFQDVMKDALSDYRDQLIANDFKASEISRKDGSTRFTASQEGIKVDCIENNGSIEITIVTRF